MARTYCEICLKEEETTKRYWFQQIEKQPADHLCYDCEKYLCSNCITDHTNHVTYSVKDKSNKNKLNSFCDELMYKLTIEGDQMLDKFAQDRTHLCDIVDVVGRNKGSNSTNIIIVHARKTWAITDWNNRCIKEFNINSNQMTRKIYLVHQPNGITEIPSTDPSQSLIAVSFPYIKQIDIMNINSKPAHAIISSINVQGVYNHLAYCNNKLITRCTDYLGGDQRDSIHVIDMTGEIINIIDLNELPGIKLNGFSITCMCVHSESETIYICHDEDPSCVISLSLNGQVLHCVKFTDLYPHNICVDRDQTVYVMGVDFLLYKLSPELSQREKVRDAGLLYKWFSPPNDFRSIACHADTFYLARSDGCVVIIRHE